MRSHLLIVVLSACAISFLFSFGSEFKTVLHFSSRNIRATGLILQSFDPFGVDLCRVIDMDLFSFFYIQLSSLTSTICWKCCPEIDYVCTYGNVIYNIGGITADVEVKSVNAIELSSFQCGKMEIRFLYMYKVFSRWLSHLYRKPNYSFGQYTYWIAIISSNQSRHC